MLNVLCEPLPLLLAQVFISEAVPPAMWWATAIWMFATGGAVGSFINVVVYRMPNGLSIVHPRSFCPVCQHPIRWWHNLPIVGWIVLGGRCYDCDAPISRRYPLVELITASMFLLQGYVEVFSGGDNLPRLADATQRELFDLWAICFYHLLLCCTLLCVGLIEFDGANAPTKLWAPIVVCGVVAPLALPSLSPVPFYWPLAGSMDLGPEGTAALNGLCGIALAALLAWPTPRLARMTPSTAAAFRAGLFLVGAFLGWQAALVLANLSLAVYLVAVIGGSTMGRGLRHIPWSAILLLLTIAWIAYWRPITDRIAGL